MALARDLLVSTDLLAAVLSVVVLFFDTSGCTTWTSVHAGYAMAPDSKRSVAGLEVRRALGSKIHSGYGLVGARLDGSSEQFDGEVHVGLMRPTLLSNQFTFVPSLTVELLRVTRMEKQWFGGALGPGLGGEFVWWYRVERHDYERGDMFGCMGGAVGSDCPRACIGQDATRHGVGFRVASEYDMRLDSGFPSHNDWVIWFMVGVSHAESKSERECCYYDYYGPTRDDCRLRK